MHSRAIILATLLVVGSALAGCLTQDRDGNGDDLREPIRLLAGPALWDDPQNAPHPAWGWPTLSHPPTGDAVPAYWAPMPAWELPSPVTGMEHIGQSPDEVGQGGGVALFGSLAVLPGFGEPTRILDLADPTQPIVLAALEATNHRGAATIAYPDGRLVAVFSTGGGIDVWDITDPTAPREASFIQPTQGGHKVGVVPGTPIVYNAASVGGSPDPDLASGVTEIYDLTDPENPLHVMDWENGYSCHHVYFWNHLSEEKYRGICAGKETTQLWNLADPLDPQVIVSIPMHHGVPGVPAAAASPVTFSHYAGLNQDGTVLIVGDEAGGGGLPPGCVAAIDTPLGSISVPVGALWFYDVSDETAPLLLGWYAPRNHLIDHQEALSCTAHHGRLVPDPDGRDILAMAFYGAGTILLDFSDPTLPVVLDQFNPGTNTWEVWYHNGHLVTGDLARGLDVLRVV